MTGDTLRTDSGNQIDEKGEDIKGEEESDCPFEDGTCIEVIVRIADTKCCR